MKCARLTLEGDLFRMLPADVTIEPLDQVLKLPLAMYDGVPPPK